MHGRARRKTSEARGCFNSLLREIEKRSANPRNQTGQVWKSIECSLNLQAVFHAGRTPHARSVVVCLIVDTNLAGLVFGGTHHPDFEPVIEWLTSEKKNGVLVVGGLLAEEMENADKTRRFILTLRRAGRAMVFPEVETELESERVKMKCKSNDSHVIALARISGARILCSNDKTLHEDFTDKELID